MSFTDGINSTGQTSPPWAASYRMLRRADLAERTYGTFGRDDIRISFLQGDVRSSGHQAFEGDVTDTVWKASDTSRSPNC